MYCKSLKRECCGIWSSFSLVKWYSSALFQLYIDSKAMDSIAYAVPCMHGRLQFPEIKGRCRIPHILGLGHAGLDSTPQNLQDPQISTSTKSPSA